MKYKEEWIKICDDCPNNCDTIIDESEDEAVGVYCVLNGTEPIYESGYRPANCQIQMLLCNIQPLSQEAK